MGGIWARLPSIRSKPPPGTPIKGPLPKIKNIAKYHYRGWVGMLLPIILFPVMFKMDSHDKTVEILWWTLLWFFFFQPVKIPVACTTPLFVFPMLGVLRSDVIVKNFMNENIQLYILSSALVLLLNNSGADRRFALWFMCSGDNCQFSGKRMVFKISTAAFFLSMFSSRIIAVSTLVQYVCPPMIALQSATAKLRSTEPNYDKMRDIFISVIHSSCSIGSLAILHSSPTMIAMKAIFTEYPGKNKMFPDCFNYFQYSVFAFPVSLLLHILNFSYHMLLINMVVKRPMAASSLSTLRAEFLKLKSKIPKRMTLHEKYSVLFLFIYLIVFFTRWSKFLNMGWADFSKKTSGGSEDIPACKDATVAAIFMTILHILPKSFNFVKVLTAEKKSNYPPLKIESSILFWRFVDKNINYAYMFVIGCGICLSMGARETGLSITIRDNLGKDLINKHPLNVGLFVICLISTILSNVITGISAIVILLPFVLCSTGNEGPPPVAKFQGEGEGDKPPVVGNEGVEKIWKSKQYLGALGVGMIATMSFMWPFLNSPPYFAYISGNIKRLTICKYGVGSAIIAMLVVYGSLVVWAPIVWSAEGINMVPEPYEDVSTTTPPADDTAPKPPEE